MCQAERGVDEPLKKAQKRILKKEIPRALQVVPFHLRHPKMSARLSLRSALGRGVASGTRHVFCVVFVEKYAGGGGILLEMGLILLGLRCCIAVWCCVCRSMVQVGCLGTYWSAVVVFLMRATSGKVILGCRSMVVRPVGI